MKVTFNIDEFDFLKAFYSEALDHLNGIEEKILQVEDKYDKAIIDEIFRSIHSVKGLSSFFSLNDIKNLSHQIETIFDRKRKLQEKIDSTEVDTLLKGTDILCKMINEIKLEIDKADMSKIELELELSDYDFAFMEELINKVNDSEYENKTLEIKIKPNQIEEVKIKFPAGMKDEFFIEAIEHLLIIEKLFIDVEKTPENIEIYNDLFRRIHSIKGNAGLLLSTIEDKSIKKIHLLNEIHITADAMESVIQKKRDEKMILNRNEIDVLLYGVDTIQGIMKDFKEEKNSTFDVKLIIDQINALADGVDKPDFFIREDLNGDAKSIAVTNTITQLMEAFKNSIELMKDDNKETEGKTINVIIRNMRNLSKLGEKIKHDLLRDRANEVLLKIEEFVNNKTTKQELIDVFYIALNSIIEKGDRRKRVEIDEKQEKLEREKKSEEGEHELQVIKVPQKRIDKLMNLIGELMISKNTFSALSKELLLKYGLSNMADKVKNAGGQVSRITDELQATIMSVRMVPLSIVFARFPRLIRDLSKKLGKNIKLEIFGEDTELDKTLIEIIGDPLVHIIRNSLDHGIELPLERAKLGKPETGTIKLKAYNQGQDVIIEISDDGGGIDPDKVKAKAIEKKIITEKEAELMSNQEIQMLIFYPGFSTAAEITDLSGRGVGMDVVKSNIERISGTISLDSKVNEGTNLKLKLPLTLAINKGVEIGTETGRYFISIDYIKETVKIDKKDIRHHKKQEIVIIRGNTMPLISLNAILGETDIEDKSDEKIYAVVMNVHGRKAALKVTKVYGEEEYLVKQLPEILSRLGLFMGAVISGNGQIKLVLDPMKFI